VIDFSLPDGIAQLERELTRFAGEKLRPRMRDFEAGGAWDSGTIGIFDGFAIGGLDLPEDWGGAGAGSLAKVVALEALAQGDAGGLVAADIAGPASAAALACPDRDLAKRVVQGCLAREAGMALLLDDAPLATWLPGNSAPAWIWMNVDNRLALLDTSHCPATPSEAGAFHASGGVELHLATAETVGDWTLQPEEATLLRGRARLWPAAAALGVAGASLEYAIAYATERVVMGLPVAHHQGNAFAIAEAAAALEAARLTLRTTAWRIDSGDAEGGAGATMAYLDSLDASLMASDLGVQLLGGHGYVEDHPVEKWYREARAIALLLGGRQPALEDVGELMLEVPETLLA
jgi:alkylation response protein AidB-like acyl-CoA dehydrogenase